MHRWPDLADYLSAELYAVAMSMLDGSYYREPFDAQIHHCGGSSLYEDGGGEGGE